MNITLKSYLKQNTVSPTQYYLVWIRLQRKVFNDGVFYDGIFNNGVLYDGVFYNGVFYDGVFWVQSLYNCRDPF
jgi:hypothetical protein